MKKIYTTLKYYWLLPLGFLVIFVISLILINFVYIPNNPNDDNIFKYICLIINLIVILFCLIAFLLTYQKAILNKKGFILKSLIVIHAIVDWKNIKEVIIEEQKTLSSSVGMNAYHNCIQIYTYTDSEKGFLKFQQPYTIIYTKNNAQILMGYLKKYSPSVDISMLEEPYDSKPKRKWFK